MILTFPDNQDPQMSHTYTENKTFKTKTILYVSKIIEKFAATIDVLRFILSLVILSIEIWIFFVNYHPMIVY